MPPKTRLLLDAPTPPAYTLLTMSSSRRALTVFSCLTLPLASTVIPLTGCGAGTPAAPSPVAIPALHGRVMGGQQPLAGTTIKLYAVGLGDNGSAATNLIGTGTNGPATSVSSGSDGSFTITGDYSCPVLTPSIPVYLTATGGNPGLTPAIDNTSIALVAALGPCDQLLANAATTYINITEATTAAAAWALAPFATSLTDIGATSTNIAGITQAFAIANQLIDISDSSSPGPSVIGWVSVESAKLYSLADILASCVNSTGTDGNCSGLFTDVTPSSGTKPTDTFSAALSVVKNPSNNVANIYKNHIGPTPPFPALSAAPNDWTITITYADGFNNVGPLAGVNISTIDQQGNLWGGNEIVEFSPELAPLVNFSTDPLPNTDLIPIFYAGPKTGVTSIDPSGDLWFAASVVDNTDSQRTEPEGAIYELGPNGNLLSPTTGYTSGGIVNPLTVMADTNGLVWVGSLGYYLNSSGSDTVLGGDISLLSSTGTAYSPATGWNVSQNFSPGIINFDSLHNAWVINTAAPQLFSFPPNITGSGSANPATIINLPGYADDIVFDTAGQAWFLVDASYESASNDTLGYLSPTGTLQSTSISGGGLVHGSELAVDASNRIFVNNLNFNAAVSPGFCPSVTLTIFSGGTGNGAPLVPYALGSDIAACNLVGSVSGGFLIDNAGSVLLDNATVQSSYSNNNLYGFAGLIRFVGLATPTKTPNTGPPQAP